jgi:Bromodomain
MARREASDCTFPQWRRQSILTLPNNTADFKKKNEPAMAISTSTMEWQPTPAEIDPLIEPSLYRLTEGLPKFELKLITTEAQVCEELLEEEIKQLEEELARISSSQEGSSSTVPMDVASTGAKDSAAAAKSPVDLMLESEFTPPDRYFTVSALLGRLRDDLATPLPPNSTLPALRAQNGLLQPPLKKKKTNTTPTNPGAAVATAVGTVAATTGGTGTNAAESSAIPIIIKEPLRPLTDLDKQKRVLALESMPDYRKEHETPIVLLALWKKISTHRTSVVFRRPVNPKEAPSYADRILFPMDLSLIRKLIVARMVKSYADLHIRIGLICHNCVKYNGR